MTEDDLAQVRAALTDEAMYRVGDVARHTGSLGLMRDAILSALAPLVRPAPTCATCRWSSERRMTLTSSAPACDHPGAPIDDYGFTLIDQTTFSCSLHTPRQSTPEKSQPTPTTESRHHFEQHPLYFFCRHCGYYEDEPLKHLSRPSTPEGSAR